MAGDQVFRSDELISHSVSHETDLNGRRHYYVHTRERLGENFTHSSTYVGTTEPVIITRDYPWGGGESRRKMTPEEIERDHRITTTLDKVTAVLLAGFVGANIGLFVGGCLGGAIDPDAGKLFAESILAGTLVGGAAASSTAYFRMRG